MSKKRAFVRYTKSGKIVPGSLITTQGDWPTGGTYKEVPIDLCCDFDPRIPIKVKGFVILNKQYDGNNIASIIGFPELEGVLPEDIGKVNIVVNEFYSIGPRMLSSEIGTHIGVYLNDYCYLIGELSYKYKYDPLAIIGYGDILP